MIANQKHSPSRCVVHVVIAGDIDHGRVTGWIVVHENLASDRVRGQLSRLNKLLTAAGTCEARCVAPGAKTSSDIVDVYDSQDGVD